MSLCVILAAGVGSRMANDCVHKALMPLKGKAIISYLIERSNSEKIVIAKNSSNKKDNFSSSKSDNI